MRSDVGWADRGSGEKDLFRELWEKLNYYETLGDRKEAMENLAERVPFPTFSFPQIPTNLYTASHVATEMSSPSTSLSSMQTLLIVKLHYSIRDFCDLPLCTSSIPYIPRQYLGCPRVHTHTHTCIRMYIWVYTYIWVCPSVYVRFWLPICTYVCMWVRMYA